MNTLIQVIKSLIPLSIDDENELKLLFTPLSLKSGDYFLETGKICRYVGFIEKGLLRYFINDDGSEKTIYFSKENEFVCNYQSLIPRKASDTSIQALEDSVLHVISYENLQEMYSNIKGGERFGRLAIEQVFISGMVQMKSLYKDPPALRYQQFLDFYPELVQRIPQYYIASYVGIEPQSLSRIRKRLVAKK
jgi:CRP-like cAMP-binding protein